MLWHYDVTVAERLLCQLCHALSQLLCIGDLDAQGLLLLLVQLGYFRCVVISYECLAVLSKYY